jgi:hypothetical protein
MPLTGIALPEADPDAGAACPGLQQLDAVLAGELPFDEATMLDEDGHGGGSSDDADPDLREPVTAMDAGTHEAALAAKR